MKLILHYWYHRFVLFFILASATSSLVYGQSEINSAPIFHDNAKIDSINQMLKSFDNENVALYYIERQLREELISRDFKTFNYLFELGLKSANELKIDTSKAYIYLINGTANYFQGNYNESKEYYLIAIEYYDRIPNDYFTNRVKNNEGNAYNNLGIINEIQGETHLALKNYLTGLEIREELKDSNSIAASFSNIGNLYLVLDDLDQGEEFYRKALEIFKALNSQSGIADALQNLGSVAAQKNNLDLALSEFKKSKYAYEQINDREGIGFSLNNMASIYLELQYPDSGKFCLDKSLGIYQEVQDSAMIAELFYNYGLYYLAIEKNHLAISAFLTSYKISSAREMIELQLATSKIISASYAGIHNYKLAYNYFKLYDSLNTNFNTDDVKERFSTIEEQYLEESRKKEAALKELELKTISNKLKYNQMLSTLAIAGLLLIIVFIIILFRKYKLEKKIKGKLEKTNIKLEKINTEYEQTLISKKEKDVLLQEIHHRVKNNLQIINSLLKIQAQKAPDNTQIIFKDLQNRITAMALLHNQLYTTKDFSKISVKDYFTQLINNLKAAYANKIKFEININVEFLDLDTLHPLGLIINEIVSNSLKYAFNGIVKKEIIYLSFDRNQNNYLLKIGDSGIGFNAEKYATDKKSIGLELIDNLAEQLESKLERTIKNGTHYQLRFSLD